MKKNLFLRFFMFCGLAIIMILHGSQLNAQTDILDLYHSSVGDCVSNSELSINVNIDGCNTDTTVIIRNVSGYWLLNYNPLEPDNEYKFFAANTYFCDSYNSSGEFQILFKSGVSDIKVKKLTFSIYDNSDASITGVSYYVNGTQHSASTADGITYDCEDNTTGFDYVSVTYSGDEFTSEESKLFVLDKLYMPSGNPSPYPTITTTGIIAPVCYNTGDQGTTMPYTFTTNNPVSYSIDWATLTDQTKTSYVFNAGSGTIPDIVIPAGTAAETYTGTMSIYTSEECSVTQNVSVTVNPLPDPTFTVQPGPTTCTGTDVTYTTQSGGGITNYVWSVPGVSGTDYNITSGSTGSSSYTVTLKWLTQGDKTITVNYSDHGCPGASPASNKTTVYTLPVPTFSTQPGPTTCAGTSVTYTTQSSTSISNYVWSVPGISGTDYNITSGGTGSSSYTVTLKWLTQGDKIVTVNYSDHGCPGASPASNTTTVYSLPVPTFIVQPGPTTCTGTDVIYTTQSGGGITNYVWSVPGVSGTDYNITSGGTGSSSNSVTLKWLTAGGKTVTVNYNSNGCPGTDPASNTTTVYLSPTPSFIIAPGANTCKEIEVTYTTESGAGISNYIWSVSGVSGTDYSIMSGDIGSSSNSVTLKWLTDGDKTVTVNYSLNGCPGVNPASITTTVPIGCPEVICLIDLSGSMTTNYDGGTATSPNQQRIAYAKRALLVFTDLLNEHFRNSIYFGLAGFKNNYPDYNPPHCTAEIYQASTLINNIPNIESTINNLHTGYTTPLLAGLETANGMWTQTNGSRAIILLSDGAHNCPEKITDYDSGPYKNVMDGISNTTKIHTIGFGRAGEVDLDLLDKIANNNNRDGIFVDLTDRDNSNIKQIYTLDPNNTNADAWDPGNALDLAYSKIFTGLDLNIDYTVEPIGIINRNSTAQFDIPISIFDNKISFFISWVTIQPDYLKVKIKTSDNTELPLNHPGISYINRDNYTIVTVSESYLTKPGIVGLNPWKLEIDASDINSASEKFQYFVLNQSKELKFNTWLDKEKYFTGDKIKIYLELLVGNQRLTNLDRILINGTMPVQGFGNLMASNKITLQQLEELKKSVIDNLTKLTIEEATRSNLSDFQRKELLDRNINSMLDNMNFNSLKAQMIDAKTKGILTRRIKIKGILFNDEGKSGDEKAGDGIYTAEYKKITKEGLYSFSVSAIDSSKGKNIKRENQLDAFARVRIKPGNFIKRVTRIDTLITGKNLYKVTLNLRDKYGNIPSPNSLKNITLELGKGEGELVGSIQSDPDGSFTQMVAIHENIKPSDVKITMKVYDQEGIQRIKSRIPWWIYVAGICVISVLTGAGVNIIRK